MQDRLTEVEIRLAHVDQSLSELSDVVYEQTKLIQQLETHCKELQDRLESVANSAPGAGPADEKPPHY